MHTTYRIVPEPEPEPGPEPLPLRRWQALAALALQPHAHIRELAQLNVDDGGRAELAAYAALGGDKTCDPPSPICSLLT